MPHKGSELNYNGRNKNDGFCQNFNTILALALLIRNFVTPITCDQAFLSGLKARISAERKEITPDLFTSHLLSSIKRSVNSDVSN